MPGIQETRGVRPQPDGVRLRLHIVHGQGVEIAIGLLAGADHSHGVGVIIDGANVCNLAGQIGVGQGQGSARARGQ
jgi:hypothetical protein